MEMQARDELEEVEAVASPKRASALLNPLRARILALSREPSSASTLARQLGLPRQRVNYHVRTLERAGFLRPAGRARRGNMIEQRYVATARAFVLSPAVLGPVAADWRDIGDTASAAYLLALAEQMRADIERAQAEAQADDQRISTICLKSQFRFETAAQRTEFAAAVREAVIGAIARHSSANRLENGRPGRGKPFRLVLACYPVAAGETEGGAPGR
jgi:DNA-binding transcriptional ArsR family regulator